MFFKKRNILLLLCVLSTNCLAAYDVSDVFIQGDSTLCNMKIERVYESGGAFLIETTGARYEYAVGKLKVFQGLDKGRRRLLSTFAFDEEPVFKKVKANQDHVLFWSEKINIGIYGDSTCIVSPKIKQSLKCNGNFKPDYESSYQGLMLFDELGGIEIFSSSDANAMDVNTEGVGGRDWYVHYRLDQGHELKVKTFGKSNRIRRGIGFFYPKENVYLNSNRTPRSAAGVESILSRYDFVWYSRFIAVKNRTAWNYLRVNRPDIIMFRYIGANSTTTNKSSYFDYDYINDHHPEWFLLADSRNASPLSYRDENKRIRWDPSDPQDREYTRFYLDIGNKEFQQWAASEMVEFLKGTREKLAYPYDGLALDNVNIGIVRWGAINRRHPHFKYSGNPAAWHEAFFSYLKLLKTELNKHGFDLVTNHNLDYSSGVDNRYWDTLYNCTNGVMSEKSLFLRSDRPWYSEQEWLTSIKRHEEVVQKGLVDWWTMYLQRAPSKSHDGFLYTYCSWLLVKQSGLSYYSTDVWYDEYDLPIGEPMSGRYERDGCWFRDFVNAKVVVNPGSDFRQVTIDNNHFWYDVASKKEVKKISVPPYSGRILLASPYVFN